MAAIIVNKQQILALLLSLVLCVGGSYSLYTALNPHTKTAPIFWRALTKDAVQSIQRLPQQPLSKRPEILRDSIQNLNASLKENPMQPYAYAALADAYRAAGVFDKQEQIALWRKSIQYGPFEEKLLHWRSRLGLAYFDDLSKTDKTLLEQQLKLAWQYQWYVTTLNLQKFGHAELLLKQLTKPERLKLSATINMLNQK